MKISGIHPKIPLIPKMLLKAALQETYL